MNNIWTLLKIDFLNGFKVFDMDLKGKDRTKNLLLIGLLLFILGPLYISFLVGLWTGYDLIVELNGDLFYILMGMVLTQFIILFFSVPKILNSFYFDTDIEGLVPLPLKPYEILGSKFLSIMLGEYLKVALFYLPFILIYGIKSGAGPMYWIYGLLALLLTPVFPLSIVSIIIIFIMKVSNIAKRKDLIRSIGMIVLTFGIIFIQVFIQRHISNGNGELEIIKLISTYMDSAVKIFSKVLPISFLTSKAMLAFRGLSGLLYMTIVLLTNGLMVFTMLHIGERIYLDGFLKGGFVKNNKKNKGNKKLSYRKRSHYVAIAKKEFIMLIKTPVYFLNSVVLSLIMPIILIPSLLGQGDGLEAIRIIYRGNIFNSLRIIILIGIIFNSVGVSSSTFSREGKNFWIQKHLPIRAEDQAKGRLLVGIILEIVSSLSIILCGKLMFNMNIIEMIVVVVYSLLYSIPLMAISIIIDARKPKLNWSSPMEAIKQNMNMVKSMLVGMAYVLLLFLLSELLLILDNLLIFHIVMIVISMSLILITYRKLVNIIKKEIIK